MHKPMKQAWTVPSLEVLDLSQTFGGPIKTCPDKHGTGGNASCKADS